LIRPDDNERLSDSVQSVNQLWNQRRQIVEAVGPCVQDHDADGVTGKILLHWQVLVHGYEYLELG
jgi:hypothetical protein